jgi:hypothetical protein
MVRAMILAALLIAVSTPASVAVAKPSPAETDVAAVQTATAALEKHLDEFGIALDGKPGTDRLFEAQWRAVQTWSAHWLDRHPGATPAALRKAGDILGKDKWGNDEWDLTTASLGHGEVLVSASRGQMANVFILGSGAGGYRARWSISAPQPRLNRTADRAISFWRADIQNGHCDEAHCRMMGTSNVERLPTAANGAARFSIDAGYAQEAGGTVGRQVSLWSWQGGHARPLLVHDYALGVDDGSTGGLRGSVLHVTSKGEWDTLFACGSCAGRSTDLRFAIEPNRVRMLAPVSRTAEIDLVDRVYTRVLAHQSVGALASPAALRVIRSRLADADLTEMVMGWARWRTHGQRWACLALDGVSPIAFALDAELTRITEARALPDGGCQGEGYRM